MSRHTDESWFLHFQQEGEMTSTTAVGERYRLPTGKAVVATSRGEPIVMIERCVPSGPNGLDIAKQFKDNVRVMAAGREMLRVLTLIANSDPGDVHPNFRQLAIDVLDQAEPPLFNVTYNNNVGAFASLEIKFTGTNDECFNYILQHQGQSVDYALKHGGWRIDKVQE
jgi:hypothetical protein